MVYIIYNHKREMKIIFVFIKIAVIKRKKERKIISESLWFLEAIKLNELFKSTNTKPKVGTQTFGEKKREI